MRQRGSDDEGDGLLGVLTVEAGGRGDPGDAGPMRRMDRRAAQQGRCRRPGPVGDRVGVPADGGVVVAVPAVLDAPPRGAASAAGRCRPAEGRGW